MLLKYLIEHYVDSSEPEGDIAEFQRGIEGLETELTNVRKKMDEYLKRLGV